MFYKEAKCANHNLSLYLIKEFIKKFNKILNENTSDRNILFNSTFRLDFCKTRVVNTHNIMI